MQHVTVAITDDSTPEGNEFFNLTLGALNGAGASQVQVADGEGLGLIGRNDANAVAMPMIVCSPIVVGEGDGYGEFTVQLSTPGSSVVSVNYALNGLIAYEYGGAGGDFTSVAGTLKFAPGVTTQTVRFELNQQTGVEAIESLYLTLSSATNATLAHDQVFATIVDNDRVVADADSSGTIESDEKANLSVRDVIVDEKAGTATFDLILDQATTDAFTVAYSTATQVGTATAGADFTAASGSLSFAAGQTVQHVTVAITDDSTPEGNEFFNLTLGALNGAGASQVEILDGTGAAFIGANEQAVRASPTIDVRDAVVIENQGYADVLIQLNAPSAGTVSASYRISGGTASEYGGPSGDFTAVDGELVFAPGETTRVVRIEINDQDSSAEPATETLSFSLAGVSGATVGRAAASIVIADEDYPTTSNPLSFGLSNDTYVVDGTNDLVLEADYGGTDVVNSYISYTLARNVENLTLMGSASLSGTGNTLHNKITGNSGSNTLRGGAGNDTLAGGTGDDKLYGDAGADSMSGGSGNDSYYVDHTSDIVSESSNSGIDTLIATVSRTLGNHQEDLTLAGTADLSGTGNTLANRITGNTGNNTLRGGAGRDTLDGGSGYDSADYSDKTSAVRATLNGSNNAIVSIGGVAEDTLKKIENLIGGTAADRLTGDGLANVLTGNTGGDTLLGMAGNDVLKGGSGRDTLDGGAGTDAADYSDKTSAVLATLNGSTNAIVSMAGTAEDTLKNIENLIGGSAADRLTGDGLANVLIGNAGNDTLLGMAGNDVLRGSSGRDTLDGGIGNDTADYADKTTAVSVTLNGSTNVAVSIGGTAEDTLKNIENLIGGSAADRLTGDGLANVLTGNAGNDTLLGMAGNDVLKGGAGRDTLDGGAGTDSADYSDQTTAVSATLNGPANAAVSIGGVAEDTLRNIENFIGGAAADRLIGDGLANRLTGNGGSDFLYGGAGSDTLVGGAGKDGLGGGIGSDIFDFNALNEMGTSSSTWDIISDFVRGQDRIDLSTLDANTATSPNDAFRFIGSAAFSANATGQLRYVYESSKGYGVLFGSTDADTTPEFAIQLMGVSSLSSSDFNL